VASHASQKVGEITGSPTGIVWHDAGQTLLCSRTVNGVTNIWEFGLSDANLKQITFGAGPDLSPMPSAAAKGIYFVNGRRSGFLTVYNMKTKQSLDLTQEEATQPALSWDGRHVMYITLSGNAQQGDLWFSDIDGSNRTKITSGTELITVSFTGDGSKLAFAVHEGGNTKIYIVKTNGTGLRQIPWSGVSGGYGAPSPDPNYFYLGGQETDLAKVTTWKVKTDGSGVEKVVDNCGAVWDTSPDGKYLLTSLLGNGAQSLGISEFSLADGKCISLLPDTSTLVVRFASDGKAILYVASSHGATTIYRQPWHDGKLAGPVQAAVKLPFAFRQDYSGNAYDFSKDLSTVVYARPGGNADLYLLSQK
jgi:Tol biopolymer transport system component